MVEVEKLELPTGEAVEFRPGGLHLMLMGPMRPLRAGDSVAMQLQFEGRQELDVEFTVRGRE